MPTLCYSSPLLKTAADGLSLVMGVTHQLKLATGDHPVLKLQRFPPSELLDVLSSTNILLRLTGSFQGKEIRIETLRQSSLVVYLLEYLKFVRRDPAFWCIHSLPSPPHSMRVNYSSAASLTPMSALTELSSVRVV